MSTRNRRMEEEEIAPKALRYAEKARAAEQILVAAKPEIMTKLVTMAKEGNIAAARYLCDRLNGSPARRTMAAVDDQTLPYTNRDWGNAKYHEERKRETFLRELFTKPVKGRDEILEEVSGKFPGIGRPRNIPPDLSK